MAKRGSIHSDQVCPVCGSKFKNSNSKGLPPIPSGLAYPKGLFCPNHMQIVPTKYVVRFENITKRFNNYEAAEDFLTGLNFECRMGQFDSRDYQVKAKPLSFDRLADEWLDIKNKTLRPKAHQPIRNAMEKAVKAWGSANIKTITYTHIEDFVSSLRENLAPKTVKNTLDAFKQFWGWAVVRYDIPPLKAWPEIGTVEMAMRKTISTAQQEMILAKVKESAGSHQLKIWLATKWLMTYSNVRPGEIVCLLEGNMDYETGLLLLPANTKERKPKFIELLDDDIELLQQFPKEHPSLPFFRHESGRYAGQQFGPQLLWKYGTAAAKELGILGVDFYGMTKHSAVTNMLEVATPDEILETTGHQTSKAFRRYLQVKGDRVKEIRSRRQILLDRAADNRLITEIRTPKKQESPYLQ